MNDLLKTIVRTAIRLAIPVARFWWRLTAPITVGVHAVVADDRGEVLLVRHTYGTQRSHLPGGRVKRKEELLDALTRELHEEAGLDLVDPDAAELLGVYTNFNEGKSDHSAVFVLAPGTWKGEAEPSGMEISELGFYDPDDLPDHVSRGARRRIEEFLGRREVDFEW